MKLQEKRQAGEENDRPGGQGRPAQNKDDGEERSTGGRGILASCSFLGLFVKSSLKFQFVFLALENPVLWKT